MFGKALVIFDAGCLIVSLIHFVRARILVTLVVFVK